MRRCARCGERKPGDAFHWWRGKAHGYCRACRVAYNAEWYAANRKRHIEKVRANTRRYIERNHALVAAIKDQPCADCGVRYPPYVMEFDHVSGVKLRTISEMVRSGASVESILAEIAKCELVCANCHRVRTARRGWRGTRRWTAEQPELGI